VRTYQGKLEALLDSQLGAATGVRLRLSGNDQSGTWDILEFHFQVSELELVDLQQQPSYDYKCQTAGDSLGAFAKQNVPAILDPNPTYQYPAGLAARMGVVFDEHAPVITLGPSLLPATQVDQVRRALSLNSCNGCHEGETGTNIRHVSQRDRSCASQLSGFLTGTPLPTADYHVNTCDPGPPPGIGSVPANPPVVGKCNANAVPQLYNDLLRRDNYLQSALSRKWQYLARYAAIATH
jgi:hypothetical protein